jgi:hypothetical protein
MEWKAHCRLQKMFPMGRKISGIPKKLVSWKIGRNGVQKQAEFALACKLFYAFW